MTWKYSDYLDVDQRYYEFFSVDADQKDRSYWKTFIPHEAMLKLLGGLLDALERVGGKTKSLWIHGAYGTGKTHAQFVLKHLLEDPWEEVAEYLQTFNYPKDLVKRLEARRTRGDGLVIFVSSTAHITSNARLMAEVQHAIKDAVVARGGNIATPTFHDTVMNRLGPDSTFNWEQAFIKRRRDFPEFASAESVLDQLRGMSDNQGRAALMERVARVMQSEGFTLSDDPASVKQWIKEVISHNSYPWLVFIWDEFTDFFHNVPTLSGLQELAHLTTDTPFYLVLATHRAPEIIEKQQSARREDWSKLADRFTRYHYEMAPITAYRLMRSVIHVKPGRASEWDLHKAHLWDSVRPVVAHILEDEGEKDDLRGLLPVHPYAGFLLSSISQQFSSSQRTLFKLLKQGNAASLPEFLAEYPDGRWEWYTVDYLWDYFFAEGDADLPAEFREVVTWFREQGHRVTDPLAKRVFKAAMLFLGLNRATSGVSERLQPRLSILRRAYAGTSLAADIEGRLKALVDEGILHGAQAGFDDAQYTIPSSNIDRRAVFEIASKLGFHQELTKPLSVPWIHQLLDQDFKSISDPDSRRQKYAIVSAPSLTTLRERVIPSCEPFQIPIVLAIPLSEAEAYQAREQAAKLAQENLGTLFVIPDACFGEKRWEQIAEASAYKQWYAEHSDSANSKVYENRARGYVQEWHKDFLSGTMHAYEGNSPLPNLSGFRGYQSALGEAIQRRFPYRPELILPTSTLFRDNFGASGAEYALIPGKVPSGEYRQIAGVLTSEGMWPNGPSFDPKVFERKKDHPLARMRAHVESMFRDQDSVPLFAVWEEMQKEPFGLLPSPMGVLLMGLLLQDYVDGYYGKDTTTTYALDRTKMAELINNVMHGKPGVSICQSTPTQREFCEILRQVFSLPADEARYPLNALDSLRTFLKEAEFPLWALEYEDNGVAGRVSPLQQLLLSSRESPLSDQDLRPSLDGLGSIAPRLKSLVASNRFESGMRVYIKKVTPDVLNVAARLQLSLRELMATLHNSLNEEVWMWTEAEIESQLPKIRAELELMRAINLLVGGSAKSLGDATKQLQVYIRGAGLPFFVWQQMAEEPVSSLLADMSRLLDSPYQFEAKSQLASDLTTHQTSLRSYLQDRTGVLARWVRAKLEPSLTDDEAKELLDSGKVTTEQSEGDFGRVIQDWLRARERRTLIVELQSLWRELTASDAPESWSRTHGVPIRWLLDSEEYHDLLSTTQNPNGRSTADLRRAMELIRTYRADISGKLGNLEIARMVVREAVQDVDLDKAGQDELLVCLKRSLGDNVHHWARGEVRKRGEEWLSKAYEQHLKGEAKRRVAHASEEDLRTFVAQLVEFPQIGLWLLKRVK